MRAFFAARDVLEVDTPQLAHFGVTEPHIDCIAVAAYGYLQSSPEYHMKRLLAAGSGPIYQLCKAFRHGEAGRRHNPEFTLLEWYQPGYSLAQLIDECVALCHQLFGPVSVSHHRFRDVFLAHTGLDPLNASAEQLIGTARQHGAPDVDSHTAVDYLMATVVEPALPAEQLVVVSDFPSWAAALAQTHVDDAGDDVALRFEIYFRGLELANGYQELTDAAEQHQRFERDQQHRRAAGLPAMASDPWLLAAMDAGLPACCGVAMGVDRLLMAQGHADSIAQVQAFPWDRA